VSDRCNWCHLHPALWAVLAWTVGVSPGRAGEHPRLLISRADVPRLRHACGIETTPGRDPGAGRFGACAADFQALRASFAHPRGDETLPGELPAAAFLHLVDPRDTDDAARLRWINSALQRSTFAMTDLLEAVLALDWCWGDLDLAARRELLLGVRNRAAPLTAGDSPLDARRFSEKLAAVALALAVDETDDPSSSWTALRARLLNAARTYFATTFPAFVAWRSLSPTSPASAASEERDTALAIELAGQLLERDLWPEYQASVGRWLEHYVFAARDGPAWPQNFIRDDGGCAPLTTAPAWRDLLPLTAHLIAARTRDPAAATVADQIERALRDPAATDPRALWRWVPIVFGTADVPRCDPGQLPAARNLGGAVLFRGGHGPDLTAVWIDAAQPFLRRRQHFDAGHFLICRGGYLAVDGGDDVVLDAIASKGGSQHLGSQPEPFDFEQYLTATIAHNCVVFWDPAKITRWYKASYLPVGGQRCVEDTCADFATPLEAQGRRTGRQLAYGQHENAAYLALDLAPAYESRAPSTYTREFIFLCERVLIVLDRVTSPKGRPVPTWVLNLPARPQVDGAELNEQARVAGSANDAGVWRYDDATWLRWTADDGALWLSAPLPGPRCLRVVGGPARQQRISDGHGGSCGYVGGDSDGFERLIIPAERRGARNAWYRLGQPTLVGTGVGQMPHWGRIEIEPPTRGTTVTFLTVLVAERADQHETPTVNLASGDRMLVLDVGTGEDRAALHLPKDTLGGAVNVDGTRSFAWTLPVDVEPDAPLASVAPARPHTRQSWSFAPLASTRPSP